MKKKLLASALALTISASMLASCSGTPPTSKSTSVPNSGASSNSSTTAKEFSYPMSSGDEISYWVELNSNISANFSSMNDTPYVKGLTERTGVKVNYQHPPSGQGKEQFNLIVADGDMPDVMEYNFLADYPGGPEKAIKDGVILELNDIIDKYCPNLKAYLAANPDIDKMVKTDSGVYYNFPMVRGGEELCVFVGLIVRDDLLAKYKLEAPQTLDDWYTVLKTFKENGITSPLSAAFARPDVRESNPFVYASGVNTNFYIGDDGKVHYGAGENNYKKYLETFAKWYKEGLIDPDFASLNLDQVGAKMTNGTSAVSWGYIGSNMGAWLPAGQATDANYSLSAVPFISDEKGKKPEFGFYSSMYDGNGAAITGSCKDVERVARFLDYAYSQDGALYSNFGAEGVSYTLVNNEPVYSDLILKNPDGWSIGQAMSAYCTAPINAPRVQDTRYLSQFYQTEAQNKAPKILAESNARAHKLPPISPTPEESKELATIMNELRVYQEEMELKFILGTESLEKFDSYLENLGKMKLDRALEIQNAALDRYNAR